MDLAYRQPTPHAWSTLRLRLGAVLAIALTAPGCTTTSGGFWSAWKMGTDSSLTRPISKDEMADNRNLMARWLGPKRTPYSTPEPRSSLVLGSDGWKPMKAPTNPEADAEIRAAEKLYQQGKLVEAEAAFAPIIRKRKGTPWGEKAQFLTAECQFQRGKLVAAHDSYELLLRDYPGTEYRDRLVAREFAIAERWLALDDPKAKPDQKLPWYARFDGRRPLVDTQGNAISALEHVRQHDPIGPLADDAVLRIADIHMGNGEFELAAMHYDQLSSDHAKSPFVQKAQLASIDARMKAYIGPEYDGGGLEKARDMIKQTMAIFPDHPENQEKLYHTLALISDAEAERTYMIADYYKRTGKVISAEYEFGKVRHRWPKSPWAVKAKAELAVLAKMPRKEIQPSKIMGMPNTDPNSMQGAMGGGMGGMGMGGMGMGGMGGMN